MPRLIHAELYELHLPLTKTVDWTVGGAESAVPYLVLLLIDDQGNMGGAEITCRPSWNAMTPGLLARAFTELAWPRLVAIDSTDDSPSAAAAALSAIRGAGPLKAIADNAWRDLVLPAGDAKTSVQVSAVLTRGSPTDTAEAALRAHQDMGLTAFKVKLGQGLATDAAVLTALRDAFGESVDLSGDANSFYALSDLPNLFAMAQDHGLSYLEDPCPLWPDLDAFKACTKADVPVVADKPIETADLAETLARMGLPHCSAKPNRLGASETHRIAGRLTKLNGRIVNGTYSESAFGTHAQIAFAQSLPPGLAWPHEIAFHRDLAQQIAPLAAIKNGLAAPVTGRATDRLDIEALQRLATASHRLTT